MRALPCLDQGQGRALHSYLRRSFQVVLASRRRQSGQEIDVLTANVEVAGWLLREVAHRCVNRTANLVSPSL